MTSLAGCYNYKGNELAAVQHEVTKYQDLKISL